MKNTICTALQIFDIHQFFILVWRRVTFTLGVLNLWQPKFVSHEESTGSLIDELIFKVNNKIK